MPNAIETKGVTEGAFQYLIVHIITGHLAPGSKLSETELASQLEISRSPLREAFRRLENERLVVSIPKKGCYVAEISLENCHEICQVWEMIELFAIDLLRSMVDKDFKDLRLAPATCWEVSRFCRQSSACSLSLRYLRM